MPRSAATTVDEYLQSLPDTSRAEISRVRDVILASLPTGYVEGMAYGMNALHLVGVYSDKDGAKRLGDAFARAGKRLDMGKGCVRFKSANDLALDAIAASIASLSVDDYISLHERSRTASRTS